MMTNELKEAIDRYFINYINLCNQMIDQVKNSKLPNGNMLSALNDSTRVIASHIRRQNSAGD